MTHFFNGAHFLQCDPFFTAWLIFSKPPYFAQCGPFFQMWHTFPNVFHLSKRDSLLQIWLIFQYDQFFEMWSFSSPGHSVTHFSQYVPFFFKCDAFFTVWPIFPNVTNFSECDPLFYRVAQSSKCVPYFIVWTIFHIVYHFSKCDPILPVWPNFCRVSTIMERIDNENAAGLRRKCKRSDQPKIERLGNNARLILRKRLKVISLK